MMKELSDLTSLPEPEEKNVTQKGTLYLVTTPIGNLADLSPRAQKVLRECDFVAAEDTRNTLRLLTCFGIKKELVSYHEHNKAARGPQLCRRISAGECCALVTDAGMPAISDPGEDIVRLCAAQGIPVSAVPGCCAATTALSLSALSTARFVFEGFLPQTNKERTQRLADIACERRTVILYEAPHRLKQTLSRLCEAVGGDRQIALCRELTKRNEEVERLLLSQALANCDEKPPRGEYVLILEGLDEYCSRTGKTMPASQASPDNTTEALSATESVAHHEAGGMTRKDAIKAAAAERGMSKSAFYQLLINEKED